MTIEEVGAGDNSKEVVTLGKISIELLFAAVGEGVKLMLTKEVLNVDDTLAMEREVVSLKNGLIPEPEPKSSGVGVGVDIVNDVIDCDGVICSVKIAELAVLTNGVGVIMVV